MAKNNGKKFNTTLKETIEQEGMIRRLKEAGLYDHNSSYYEQQQLDAVIQQSKEDAKRISKSDQEKDLSSEERVDLPAKRIPKLDQEKDLSSEERVDLPVEKVTGFEDDFHIVNDDDLTEITPKDTSSSTQKSGKKKPVWNEISDDEDDFFQTKGKADGALKIAAKSLLKNNASKLQKANLSSTDSQKVVPVESYGNKMVAASRKKSEDNTESPNSGRLFKSRRGDLIISPDEINDILSDKKSDTEDDDFVSGHPPPRQNKTINRNKTEQSNPGPKQKVAAMKVLCKKYSEMLIQIKNVPAFPFPEDPNFDSSVPRQQLIENEERLKASRSSNFDPIKWSKPIILSATNSRRRRPIFNQPSTSRRTPPEDAQVDSVDAVEIVCDSPPAASVRKLDISPSSPILKTRKRSDGSNGIPDTEMEVDRKSPIVIKEDSTECPICNKLFPLSAIENHVDGCINNVTEERPRSERIARNTRFNKLVKGSSDNSQWGNRSADTSIVSEFVDPDILFETDGSQPDSDFEPDQAYDPGTKRNQRKKENVGVKKRRV